MFVSRLAIVSTIAASFAAGTAFADGLQLTSAEYSSVTEACEIGLPLFPVESDFGHETGQYALPISDENGNVHSALIVDETALQDIPACRGEVETMVAQARDVADDKLKS